MLVFLPFNCLCDKYLGNVGELPLIDGFACHVQVVCALVDPHVEALKWLVRVAGILEVDIVCCEVSGQNIGVIPVYMSNEYNCWD